MFRPARPRVLRWVAQWWPAVAYPAAFLVASLAVAAQPPTRGRSALLWASTNLDNLADHPVRALVASAVLSDEPAGGDLRPGRGRAPGAEPASSSTR
jgi:hypothetical protein